MTTGVDYAWSHPDPASIAATVVHGERLSFVARYFSSDMTKALGRAETSALEAAGLAIVTVWEDAAGNARLGAHQGAADGVRAAAEASADGQPAERPIFYAVDYDAPPQDWPAIGAYLDAAGHASGRPVGIYGGYPVCQRMNLDGHAAWIWQTAAWSGGKVLSNAHIYQQVAQVTIGGVTCDVNLGLTPDFGQWGSVTPQGGNDMPAPTDVTDELHGPAGSVWQLKASGEVETITGTAFYGSYLSLPAADRQGSRYFVRILARPDGKPGYRLVANDGARYDLPV